MSNAANQRALVARNKKLLPVRRERLPHGSTSTYSNHGCRCIHCTVAWRDEKAEHQARRKAALAAGTANPPHGSYSTYTNYACRCDPCREAARAAHKRSRKS